MIEHAIEHRCFTITLEVHERNFGADRLYQHFGFEQLSLTEEPYYADGGKAMKMKLRIKSIDKSKYTTRYVADLMRSLNNDGRKVA